MSVEELIQHRLDLEIALALAIFQFEKLTGTNVSDVYYDTDIVSGYDKIKGAVLPLQRTPKIEVIVNL